MVENVRNEITSSHSESMHSAYHVAGAALPLEVELVSSNHSFRLRHLGAAPSCHSMHLWLRSCGINQQKRYALKASLALPWLLDLRMLVSGHGSMLNLKIHTV